MTNIDRYLNAVAGLPAPGNGYHGAILGAANLGVSVGLKSERIFSNIREHTLPGTRRIADREIIQAINKAVADRNGGSFKPRQQPKPVVKDGSATLKNIIGQGNIIDDDGLRECSPVPLNDEPQADSALLIENLYKPDDLVWIGDRHQAGIVGGTIRASHEWIPYLRNGGTTAPHIIINPLNGIPVLKKSGDGQTLRGDGNVASYRYCLVEFDTLPREDQIRFWSAARLPIVCLIDSGGKSIHAWLDVQKLATVTTSEAWQSEIKGRLYDRLLTPLGVDSACSNPARLSRLPGHLRADKGKWQRLLWLAPEGRPVCS